MSAETTEEDETGTEDGEENESGGLGEVSLDESKMLGAEMTKDEIRVEIGQEVGVKCWEKTQIPKEHLNSIHAALTGSFIEQPRMVLRDGSKQKSYYYAKVGQASGFVYLSSGENIRPYTKDELRRLLYEIKNTDDQRAWVKTDSGR